MVFIYKIMAALYIHIPFCIKKCSYCDFYSIKFEPGLVQQFLNAIKKEIELYAHHPVFSQCEFQTLYGGGGTPSLLSANQITELAQQAQNNFYFSPNFEFTLEVNPETITLPILKEFRNIGVNRSSIGVQSFSDLELQQLGRLHNVEQAKRSIEWAKQAGFENISLDLIFAIPGQSIDNWLQNLEHALAFEPQHLSTYGLTLEPGTLLAQEISCGQLRKTDEETERKMYLETIAMLSQHGYRQYEISNFALPGYECRHNQMYWDWSSYLGVGPSAHSFWHYHRQWNINSFDQYCRSVERGEKPVAGEEDLSPDQKLLEYIYLNLRTATGIDIQQFEDQFHFSFKGKFKNVFNKLQSYPDNELFQLKGNTLKLTPTSYVLFDKICQYFAEEI